jgi:serine/threonine-protein kinase
MGSVHYLSPEQARGGYSDEKSDIYSLGVTLYEMLSGKVPFAGDNTVSVAMLHIQGEAKPLRELEENIPLSVDKIVQKCMQKKPERRYHSASDLIVDLKRALSNPNGDFVQIPSFVANDSPTINISDDLGKIKNSSYYSNDNYRNSRNNPVINDDDEDLDTVDSKLEKVFTVLTIVAIVAIAAAIMFIIFKFVIPSGEKEKKPDNNIVTEAPTPEPTEEPSPTPSPEPGIETYEFPNVIGHKLEDAIAAIEARNPKAHINPMEDYSNEYEVGYVIRQYPLPNTDYPVDSEVILYVSIGPSSEIIPYVYGNTWEQAEQKLKEYDLVPERVDQYSNDVPAGNVIATDPPKESMVKAGDNVKVYVSMGPEVSQTAVPDLIGKTTAEAETLLKDAGLVLGEVSQDTSETYAIGKIIYQDTTVGELVDRGTKINVTVSTGPDTEVPGTGNYRYVGSLYIEINPFYYTGDGEADIILEMEQGGYGTEIYHEMTSISDFPMTLNDIEGESLEIGVVKMYIDGEIFKDEEGNPYVWIVEFEAVED